MSSQKPPAESAAPAPLVADTSDTPGSQADVPPSPRAIVAIGASAGGLAALQVLFREMPGDTGLAFVIVVHLSPEHESRMAELLQSSVAMPVTRVTETVPLEPDHVYVIPPNRNLEAIDTHLRLTGLEPARKNRAPIDHFMRTLAAIHGRDAVALVLTGTGTDGTLGLREIRQAGGLTIVQDPNEADFDGMPRSAIEASHPDAVLELAAMPAAILRYFETRPRLDPDDADAAQSKRSPAVVLDKALTQVRAQTGRDFTQYKRSSLLRRVHKRMQFSGIEDPLDYLDLLRTTPAEVDRLSDDLLVVVTRFFRDPEVFQGLEARTVPQLFERRPEGRPVRAWSVGCATGEEAYTVAILLLEEAHRRQRRNAVQVFASDLHGRSLEQARRGFYPGDIAVDVSAERLARFFSEEAGGYRIRADVRDVVTFTPHNLLGDPPFSGLDLITCRNLLIYLERDLQKQVIELFHYALAPGGVLVLGTSEAVQDADLFRTEHKGHGIYVRRDVPGPEPRLPVFPVLPRGSVPPSAPPPERETVAYGPVHCRLMEQYALPTVLVSPTNTIMHYSAGAGRYLTQPGGSPTSSLLQLVPKDLRLELRTALSLARDRKEKISTGVMKTSLDGKPGALVIHACPAGAEQDVDFVLVMFEPLQLGAADDGEALPAEGRHASLVDVEGERARMQERIQSLVEDHEASQEELKASNEELQSANEELRSTLEELETSKEELQSINEELQSMNQENRHKVDELAGLSADLRNLLLATEIATLFLDRQLRIVRFTPGVADLFNVRAIDKGRPLSDLTHRLQHDTLEADARRVLERLTPLEREVRDAHGKFFLTRVLPYRSHDDRIAGVVITFVDITARKHMEDALRRSEEFTRRAAEAGCVGTWELDLETGELNVSPQMARLLGEGDVVEPAGQTQYRRMPRERWRGLLHADDRDAFFEQLEGTDVEGDIALESRVRVVLNDGTTRWLHCKWAHANDVDKVRRLRGAALDVSHTQRTESVLRDSERRLTSELGAMNVLHRLVADLLVCTDLGAALHQVLSSAMEITGAEMASVALLDEAGALRRVAQRGLGQRALDLAMTHTPADGSPADLALRRRERVVVEDASELAEDLPLRRAANEAPFRALQVTPLLRRDGQTLGVFVTYYRVRHRPDEQELRMLDLYARQAADFIEHQANDEALRRSESLFRAVFEVTGVAAVLADRTTGRLVRWNETFRSLVNLEGVDLAQRTLHDLTHAEDRETLRRGFVQLAESSSHSYDCELRLTPQGGAPLWVLVSANLVTEANPSLVVMLLLDISRRKRAEFQLSEENRRKDEHLAMLGHELRNPLASMRSAVELAKLMEIDDPVLRSACAVLDRQSAHMARVIDGLLEVSRLARGKVQLALEDVDLRGLLRRVVEDRQAEAVARGLELRVELPLDDAWVAGDVVRLTQVFDNLVGNGIKFTDSPGSVTLSLAVDDGWAIVRVADTGIGISAARLASIFDSFYQGEQPSSRASAGLGLGLSVAKGFVDLHGGRIEGSSDGAGKGAQFCVRLPLAQPPEDRSSTPDEAQGPATRSYRVLLVEEDTDAREMLTVLLERRGHRVWATRDGPSAIVQLRREAAEVVLCALSLRGMSGHDVARAIRADPALTAMPLVALTGRGTPGERERALEAGFDAHLVKPVSLLQVETALAQVFHRGRMPSS